jgi:hypothetical protein
MTANLEPLGLDRSLEIGVLLLGSCSAVVIRRPRRHPRRLDRRLPLALRRRRAP